MLKPLVNLAAAAAFALLAGPALAQVQTIDPNQVDTYQPEAEPGFEEPAAEAPAYENAYEDPSTSEWTPIDESNEGTDTQTAPAAQPAPVDGAQATIPREDVFSAA